MIDLQDLAAKSDQLNAVDFVKPVVFRITEVVYRPKEEQCIALHLDGYPGRPYKPCKGMLRGLSQAWTMDETTWSNRLIELYCDPTVKWGGADVGGIRISAVSGIDAPYEFPVAISRSKRVIHTFNVLPDDQKVTKEFILTHHVSNIDEAATDADITAIVKSVGAEFGAESQAKLKDSVIAARAKLAEASAQPSEDVTADEGAPS